MWDVHTIKLDGTPGVMSGCTVVFYYLRGIPPQNGAPGLRSEMECTLIFNLRGMPPWAEWELQCAQIM